jgi:dihydrodipicolinate synthase/N-acetylneuraminate lyase
VDWLPWPYISGNDNAMAIRWAGVFPALTTPFRADERLDLDALERKIDAQLAAGVQGLILAGSLGEAGTLSREEKLELLRVTRVRVAGRVPVLLNLAESRTHDALLFAEAARAAGADGLMVLPPLRYRADGEEVVAWFEAIARESDLPLMLYHNPVDYGIGLDLRQLERLLRMPTVQAIKESTRDVTQVLRLKAAFGDRLAILCGVDTLALESFLLGADGWVAGLVNAFPRETMAVYRLAQAGDWEKARAIYRWFMPLLELDIHPKLVQYIKLAEEMAGEGPSVVRAPRRLPEGEELARVRAVISEGLRLRPALG